MAEIIVHRETDNALLRCGIKGLLIMLQCLEGVILLHAAVAPLDVYLEGVQTLAPGGGYRQQGEDECNATLCTFQVKEHSE